MSRIFTGAIKDKEIRRVIDSIDRNVSSPGAIVASCGIADKETRRVIDGMIMALKRGAPSEMVSTIGVKDFETRRVLDGLANSIRNDI